MERNTYLATDSSIKTGVYKLINTLNNKVYIGSTSQGFYERKHMHLYELRRNKHSNYHLQKAWNKYGEDNFIFEIIERVEASRCIEREQYWMNYYDCCNINKGYNLKPIAGSSLGYKYTKEQRENISKGLTTKKEVIQLTLDGVFLRKFESIKKASRELNIQPKLISECCRGKQSNAKGYNFIFKEDFNRNECYKIDINTNKRITKAKVIQRDLQNNIIKKWNSLSEVVNNNKFIKTTITAAIKGRLKTAYGFKWEYEYFSK